MREIVCPTFLKQHNIPYTTAIEDLLQKLQEDIRFGSDDDKDAVIMKAKVLNNQDYELRDHVFHVTDALNEACQKFNSRFLDTKSKLKKLDG